MEDFGGDRPEQLEQLDQLLGQLLGGAMSLERFFPLAIHLADAVAQLHALGVIHRGLRPANVLVNARTGAVKVANFASATRIPSQKLDAADLVLETAMLPYMAPEQTGRMNRAVDFRCDLYALGVMLYQMLSGQLPFEAHDPMEWVHSHIARVPTPLRERNSQVPQVVSDIVDKLLAKMADHRYQTAAGLGSDLETCWRELRESGRITPFALGTSDVSPHLIVSEKLYGREHEVAVLVDAFERVVASGMPEVVLVTGYSGIGKSALVQELYRPIIRQRCYFVGGKFDQYKRDVPYALLAQAFRGLVRQLLAESEVHVDAWRARIRSALGVNAQLVVDIVPELAVLIGPQQPVTDLPVAEAQRRFFQVFEQFVGVFARPERPLVLFLDDLQWVDAASLELLEHLLTARRLRGFLFIGGYRDNEVGPTHPLMSMLDTAQRDGIAAQEIELAPLSPALVAQLVRDTMRSADVAPLAELLYRKTLGNPFFLVQFIKTLVSEGLIAFDACSTRWTWDLPQIEAQGYSDNVADLMSRRISRVTATAQRVMQLAAALGNRVDIPMLAMITGYDDDDARDALDEAAREGLLLGNGATYTFLHDRVRQAAYDLLPEAERPAVHLRIGRRLIAELPPDALEAHVFDVVDQLNRGLALVTDPSERLAIAKLDLVAGKRAKASGAFAAAVTYLDAGFHLLPADAWESCYELAFALRLSATESRYVRGEIAEADAQLVRLIEIARTSSDIAAAIEVRVDLLTTQRRIAEAIDVALAGLSRFGLALPRHPTPEQLEDAYAVIWELLGDRRIESLASLPVMTDAEQEAMYRVMMCVHPSAIFFDFNLYALLAAHEVILCLRHGNPRAAAFGYVVFAICLIARFHRYADAACFVTLSAELADRSTEPRLKLRASFPLWGIASFWVRSHRDSEDGLRRCFRLGIQLGDLTYTGFAGMFLAAIRLTFGDRLANIERDLTEAREYARAMDFGMMSDVGLVQRQLIQSLRGETERLGSLTDTSFDETAFETALVGQHYVAGWYFTSKLLARFWAGDVDEAWRVAKTLEAFHPSIYAKSTDAEYLYARALTIADRFSSLSLDEQAQSLDALNAYRADLAVLAQLCPENWRPRHALVSAEIARITGDPLAAERSFEDAITAARDDEQWNQYALAHERAARFYRERGFELIADTYLREAHAGYQRWGAHGKVRQLEARYPRLAQRGVEASSGSTATEALDAISIAKASRAISSSIVLTELQRVLLRLSMENAGARRGALLLVQDGQWTVEAELDIDRRGPPQGARPLADVDTLSHSLIAFVRRTREAVVLDDAPRDATFAAGFARGQLQSARSVACMPIIRQDRLVGILYLENDLVVGAFSSHDIAVVEQLAAQAAISLENARLYQDLRREIEERKGAQAALQANQARLQAIIDNSSAIIFVKDREGRYLLINSSFEATLNLRRDSTLGKTDYELFAPDEADLFRANDEQVLQSGLPAQLDELVPTPTGERTFLSLKFPLLDASGHPYAVCGIATDITERKRAEEALQDAVRLRDNFLRIASHELRTPLTPLQLQLELIRDMLQAKPEPPRDLLAERLGLSLRQVQRLRALVIEMLDVARLQSGRLELRLDTVDLCSVCHDVAADLELELVRSETKLALSCDTPVVGRWDRSRLEQVVTNLLTNAIKFGAHEPIEVDVRMCGDDAVLTVSDRGIGIASADQRRIFAPFERAVSTNYAGLGMGLYIAREIVAAHGGTITVSSEVGRGAMFTVTLPCAMGSSDRRPRGADPS
jgi:PAS domain S-box-containing protein